MIIKIVEKNVSLTEAQRELVHLRLTSALNRFANKVSGLTVTFSDLNGPRGGIDKLCRLRMNLHENGEIVLSENNTSVEGAVTHVANRAANTVQRLTERRRLYHRNAAAIAAAIFRSATPAAS